MAVQEYSLERTLDKMQGEWVGVSFDTMAWRNTGTSVLRGLDDIQMLLDDQTVKTQSMRASPYIGPFEDRVRLWEAKLNLTQVRLWHSSRTDHSRQQQPLQYTVTTGWHTSLDLTSCCLGTAGHPG